MVSSGAEMLLDVEANFILTAEITEHWPVSVAFIEFQEITTDNKSDYSSLASIHESYSNDYLMHVAVFWKLLLWTWGKEMCVFVLIFAVCSADELCPHWSHYL